MAEITSDNFEILYPDIVKSIENASIIAIDTEFSGLNFNEKPSLNDSASDRYQKLKKSVQSYCVLQIGISTFTADSTLKNKYNVDTYNFYLYPRSFNLLDTIFSVQNSAFEFLSKYNFDFNKLIYKGIQFINDQQEKYIRGKLEKQLLFAGVERDIDEKQINSICSRVADWLLKTSDGETYTINIVRSIPSYILHRELKQRFENVWTFGDYQKIVVKKITKEQRTECEASYKNEDIEIFMNEVLGFTKIFRLLVKAKKPIIGHNMLMDLMFIYEKFYAPLPNTIKEFKSEINKLFPLVYDTKYISVEIKRQLSGLYDETILDTLYNSLNKDKTKLTSIYSPIINHSEACAVFMAKQTPHQAGYDAYMCGNVFLRLAHTIATIDTKDNLVLEPKSIKDYIQVLKPFENRVFLMRAKINYVNIAGKEIANENSKCLHVKSKLSQPLEFYELVRSFSTFGNCEVKLLSQKTALVTVNTLSSAKYIIAGFQNHDKYFVSVYNMWKHSPYVKGALWGSLLVSTSLLVYTLATSRPTPVVRQ